MEILAKADIAILRFFNEKLANPFLDTIMDVCSNRNVWLIVAALALVAVAATRNRLGMYACLAIALAVTLSDWICYEWLKPFFARNRPCYEAVLQVRMVLEGCGGQFGFPSNHASNGMSIALVGGALLGKRWGIFMGICALVVGISRIYLGVHYPSDVLGGFAFAIVFAVSGLLIARGLVNLVRRTARRYFGPAKSTSL